MRVCVLLAVDSVQLFDVTEEEKGARVIDVVSKRGVVSRSLLLFSSFFVFFFAASTNSDFCHTELIQSRRYVKSVPL